MRVAGGEQIRNFGAERAAKARKVAIDVRRSLRRGWGRHFGRRMVRQVVGHPGGGPEFSKFGPAGDTAKQKNRHSNGKRRNLKNDDLLNENA